MVSLKDMANSPAISLVLFGVGDLWCALPVDAVHEIVPAETAVRIPGAIPGVEGLVNVRGRLVTVADARRVLGRVSSTPAPEPSILLLEINGRPLGLLVDVVHDLIRVDPEELNPGGAMPGVDPRVVRAVSSAGGQVFVVLDTDVILAPVFGG